MGLGARDGQRTHLTCPGIPEHSRALIECGTGRPHIIYEHYYAIVNQLATGAFAHQRREAECIADVAAAAGGGESLLWGRRAGAPERGDDRQGQRPREVVRLVESTVQPAERVQRHRDDARGAVEDAATRHRHQATKPARK